MDNLAEQVIANQEREAVKAKALEIDFFSYDLPERDELGMPTANSIEYVIARILYIDHNLSGKEKLHLREDGRIWEGDHWIAENSKNLYRITKWPFKSFTDSQSPRIWARLREVLPTLAYNKLVVKDNLIWDWENSDLYFSDEEPTTIN